MSLYNTCSGPQISEAPPPTPPVLSGLSLCLSVWNRTCIFSIFSVHAKYHNYSSLLLLSKKVMSGAAVIDYIQLVWFQLLCISISVFDLVLLEESRSIISKQHTLTDHWINLCCDSVLHMLDIQDSLFTIFKVKFIDSVFITHFVHSRTI